jgi:hypothetical protein
VPLPELPQRRNRVAVTYAAVTGLAAVAGALALPSEGLRVSIGLFSWVALGSLVVLVSLVWRSGLWTATGAYAAVFWCFHFGLIAMLASGLVKPRELSLWEQLWVLGPFGGDAALLALLGFAAFASGASLMKRPAVSPVSQEPPVGDDGAHSHGVAGSVLVLTAVASWFAIVLATSGLPGFFGSYADYLYSTTGFSTALGMVWLAFGLGIVVSLTGQRGWLRTSAMVASACVALLALPLGLRGEIMFPAIAALVAAARCGWVLSPAKVCAFVAALLVIIPTVRDIRTTGLQGLPDKVLELRLFDGFVEMGGSLHPVEKVVRWRAEGDPLEMGASYWAPIERAAGRILPGMRTAAAEHDMRIMNVLVTDRIGPIGFSPVAEAYRNFGPVGVVFVLGLIGALLARIDRIADRRAAVLVIAMLFVPLLVNVRNSFVSVPFQCGLGVLLVLALRMTQHTLASIRFGPYARSLASEAGAERTSEVGCG